MDQQRILQRVESTRMDQKYLQNIKKDFPCFQYEKPGGLIFFDNASTTQKPRDMIEATSKYYSRVCYNVHRGSFESTTNYEQARAKIANFIGANPQEITFTSSTTYAINLISSSLAHNFQEGDEIIITIAEHNSNVLPWQKLAANKKMKLRYVPATRAGVNFEDLYTMVNSKTKIVSFHQCSNVFGVMNPVQTIITALKAKNPDILTVVDGAQSVSHEKINVRDMGCSFFCFSGHKVYGPEGIGVLYVSEIAQAFMNSHHVGGGMLNKVEQFAFTSSDFPHKFEAGTPNIVGAIALGSSIDYLEKIGMYNIKTHEESLTNAALSLLKDNFPNIHILGQHASYPKSPIISCFFEDCNAIDIGHILKNMNVAVRSGKCCAELLLSHLKIDAVLRISFGIYNEEKELEIFVDALKKARHLLMI